MILKAQVNQKNKQHFFCICYIMLKKWMYSISLSDTRPVKIDK